LRALFAEELGAVIQVPTAARDEVMKTLREFGLSRHSHTIGKPNTRGVIEIWRDAKPVFSAALRDLHQAWDEPGWRIARLRDNPECADAEHAAAGLQGDPGLHVHLTFDPPSDEPSPRPSPASGRGGNSSLSRPRLAILREQGVNSHLEMSFALDRAGFETFDVHMSDLQTGRARLDQFLGFVACGGFSYGDTLGAGEGWARSVLFNPRLAEQFAAFFNRTDSIALGVCNGCQMMASLATIIPGAGAWPKFTRNQSEQYEGRLVTVQVEASPSIFYAGMEGSRIPIVVAHGEGYADFSQQGDISKVAVGLRFVDNRGQVTQAYPLNPNGSPQGIASVTTHDGRFTALMPHPERVFRAVQMSWHPKEWEAAGDGSSPWMRMFRNARKWMA
jgi:phosphoribosylformylglycinamidine synthase